MFRRRCWSPKNGLVTAITELKDGRLVMMLMWKVLSETTFRFRRIDFQEREAVKQGTHGVFADDSFGSAQPDCAHSGCDAGEAASAINGRQAWIELSMAPCRRPNTPLKDMQVILTDVEMPVMDGYMLTRKIKADKRFVGIPKMHSSLSSSSNQQLGKTIEWMSTCRSLNRRSYRRWRGCWPDRRRK